MQNDIQVGKILTDIIKLRMSFRTISVIGSTSGRFVMKKWKDDQSRNKPLTEKKGLYRKSDNVSYA